MSDHDGKTGDYMSFINRTGIGNADEAKDRTLGIEIREGKYGMPAVASINRKSTIVGSASYCNLVVDDINVPDNKGQRTIRHEQSKIFIASDLFYIKNLGESDEKVGTRVGGLPVNSPRVLVKGSQVSLGHENFIVYNQGEINNGEIITPLILARKSVINQVEALLADKPEVTPQEDTSLQAAVSSEPEKIKTKTITMRAFVDPEFLHDLISEQTFGGNTGVNLNEQLIVPDSWKPGDELPKDWNTTTGTFNRIDSEEQ